MLTGFSSVFREKKPARTHTVETANVAKQVWIASSIHITVKAPLSGSCFAVGRGPSFLKLDSGIDSIPFRLEGWVLWHWRFGLGLNVVQDISLGGFKILPLETGPIETQQNTLEQIASTSGFARHHKPSHGIARCRGPAKEGELDVNGEKMRRMKNENSLFWKFYPNFVLSPSLGQVWWVCPAFLQTLWNILFTEKCCCISLAFTYIDSAAVFHDSFAVSWSSVQWCSWDEHLLLKLYWQGRSLFAP